MASMPELDGAERHRRMYQGSGWGLCSGDCPFKA